MPALERLTFFFATANFASNNFSFCCFSFSAAVILLATTAVAALIFIGLVILLDTSEAEVVGGENASAEGGATIAIKFTPDSFKPCSIFVVGVKVPMKTIN